MILKVFNLHFNFLGNIWIVIFLAVVLTLIISVLRILYAYFFDTSVDNKFYLNNLKEKYIKKIMGIDYEDSEFAYELNLIVRQFIKEIDYCKSALYYSKNEMVSLFNNENIKTLFIALEKLEYSKNPNNTLVERKAIWNNLVKLIQNF